MQYGLQTQFTFYTSALLRAEQTRNGRSEGGAWLGPAALSAGTLTDGLVSRALLAASSVLPARWLTHSTLRHAYRPSHL